MKEKLKKISVLKYIAASYKATRNRTGWGKKIGGLTDYFRDLKKFRKLPHNSSIPCETKDLYPRIYDKTANTDIDPVYFLQGTWCAKKVFDNKPSRHFDIGSQAIMVGIISQFVPTTMVDIRSLSIDLPGLSFISGSILALPFENSSLASLSSICVIEHIGLGRYGDSLDQFGTEKAAKELTRVLAPQGNLYISVPVDSTSKVYFNAHRAFTREHILKIFEGLDLAEERYIYGRNMTLQYRADKSFGTGLFHFKKRT